MEDSAVFSGYMLEVVSKPRRLCTDWPGNCVDLGLKGDPNHAIGVRVVAAQRRYDTASWMEAKTELTESNGLRLKICFLGLPRIVREAVPQFLHELVWKGSCGCFGLEPDGKIYQSRSLPTPLVGEDYKSGRGRGSYRKPGSAVCLIWTGLVNSTVRRSWRTGWSRGLKREAIAWEKPGMAKGRS